MQKPSVVRAVLFVPAAGGEPQAAVVTRVHQGDKSDAVDLTVSPPAAMPYPVERIPYSEEPRPFTWHWPPRPGEAPAAKPAGEDRGKGDRAKDPAAKPDATTGKGNVKPGHVAEPGTPAQPSDKNSRGQ